jgi:hypothetical protein
VLLLKYAIPDLSIPKLGALMHTDTPRLRNMPSRHTKGTLMIRPLLVFAIVGLAAPAWPCSVVGPLPSAERLVSDAEVIARVRAEGLSPTPGRSGIMAESPTQVRFTILELLKGRLSASTIEFNGSLTDRDDRNDRAVPYDFIRPGGRGGNCFALAYRAGAEYLLLLRRGEHPSYAQASDLTPYWAPLSPTNEQLIDGANDGWFVWVGQQLRK